jgi:hypothetical protein
VGDDVHLGVRDPVRLAQNLRALAGHHHQAITSPEQFIHHLLLRGIRLA